MGRRVALLLVVALGAATPGAGAQEPSPSQLVVVIAGDARYHGPSCPLVAKAGSKVTVMKRSEATRRQLSAHDCEDVALEQPKREANALPVFVQAGDKRYHKAGCAKLAASASRTTLGEAGKKYWPCPACKPPIRQREKAMD